MNFACSVCGFEDLEWPKGEMCPACGFPVAKCEIPLPSSAPLEPVSAPIGPNERHATAELLKAFEAQFIERRVLVPADWTRRLAKLAEETEPSRRYATMVFVDLVGYTHLSNVLSETRLMELRRWFNTLCTTEVERHGGFLIQFLGDAAFAAFGAPWAFERDSESAARCLLAIHRAVKERGTVEGESLGVRSGAATGLINVDTMAEGGRHRPDLIGPRVNLAARLQGQAKEFEILVTGSLADLIEPAFVLEPRDPFVPKNYGETVQPYALIGERTGHVERRRTDLPFVGREHEIERLAAQLSDTKKGAFRAATIRGDAGIGKTRFAREALLHSGTADEVFHAELEPYHQHMVLQPFVQLLQSIAESDANRPIVRETTLEALDRRCGGFDAMTRAALGMLLGDAASREKLVSLPSPQVRAAVESALVDFLRNLSAQRPVFILLDDLQWADELSLNLIGRILEARPPGLALLMIGRTESMPSASSPLEAAEVITLAPLDDADRRALLASLLLARQILPDALHPLTRERLLDESGGVPLFLIEMASATGEDTGGDVSAERLVRDVVEARTLDGYARLVEIFQARLDRLEASQRLALQCGAVLGRRFRESLLAGFEELRERLMDYLSFLKGARYLAERPLPSDHELAFTPPLLRDIAYQMISAEQRPLLHGRFAALIQERFADRLQEFSVELATHWLKAGEFGMAAQWVRLACQNLLRFGAPHQAYALATEALRSAPEARDDPRTRAQLAFMREQAGLAARHAQNYAGALVHLREWEAIALDQGNRIGVFLSRYQQALVHFEAGRLAECDAILAGLDQSDENMRGRADDLRARLALRRRHYDEALGLFTAAAERPSAHLRTVGDNWNNASICLQRLGRLEDAFAALASARAAYAEDGNPFGQCIALNMLGMLYEQSAQFEQAALAYTEAGLLAEKCGYVHALSALAANTSYLRYLLGDSLGAAEQAARALHHARRIHHGNSEAIALINLALACELDNDFEGAAAHIHDALSLAKEMDDEDLVVEASLESAWIAIRTGDRIAAAAALTKIPTKLEPDLAVRRDVVEALLDGGAPPLMSADVTPSGRLRAERMVTASRRSPR